MITEKADGTVDVSFRDWTPTMMALSSRLWRLPLPPKRNLRNHEVGIDRLAGMKFGRVAIGMLFEHAADLEYCPNHSEVVKMGLALLKLCGELELLRRSQAKQRKQARINREHPPARRSKFTRG